MLDGEADELILVIDVKPFYFTVNLAEHFLALLFFAFGSTPRWRLGQTDIDDEHDADHSPLRIDGSQPVIRITSAHTLLRNVGAERPNRPPEAVHHQRRTSDVDWRHFSEIAEDGGLQTADAHAGEGLGNEPVNPVPGESFREHAGHDDQPEAVHPNLAAEAGADESETCLTDDLDAVLSDTPAADDAGCEIRLSLGIGLGCELSDETLIGDDARTHAIKNFHRSALTTRFETWGREQEGEIGESCNHTQVDNHQYRH